MSNISNIKIGTNNPKEILFDKYTYRELCKYDFTSWNINREALLDYELTNGTLIIKKFVPNKCLIYSNPVPNSDLNHARAICDYMRDTRISIYGLLNKADLLSANKRISMPSNLGAGSNLPKMLGLMMAPFSVAEDPVIFVLRCYHWEGGFDSEGNVTSLGISDMTYSGGFRFDGNGYAQYGILRDGVERLVFPNEVYGFKASRGIQYCVGIAIYSNWDLEFYDATSNPIIIKLLDFLGHDLSNVECWDLWFGNKHLYHKDKTYENCLVRHGYIKPATMDVNDELVDRDDLFIMKNYFTDRRGNDPLYLPTITDLKNEFIRVNNGITRVLKYTGLKLGSESLWDLIKALYNPSGSEYVTNLVFDTDGDLFRNSNISGDITFKIDCSSSDTSDLDNDQDTPIIYRQSSFNFTNCNIENITINKKGERIFSLAIDFFRGASNLKTVTSVGGKPVFAAYNLSGMFEWCANLVDYSPNLIDWDSPTPNIYYPIPTTSIPYAFEGCNKLTRVYGLGKEIIIGDIALAFNGCSSLITIEPVLDLRLKVLNNDTDSFKGTKAVFSGCTSLTHLKLKNLSNGDWNLASGAWNLSNLDLESVQYIINNLADLRRHSNYIEPALNNAFGVWEHHSRLYVAPFYSGLAYELLEFLRAMTLSEATDIDQWGLYVDQPFSNMNLMVKGLDDNSTLKFGDTVLHNGTNVISKTGTIALTITLTNNDNSTDIPNNVLIIIINRGTPELPKVSSATLTVPHSWSSYITSQMTTNALTKGWTIVINS